MEAGVFHEGTKFTGITDSYIHHILVQVERSHCAESFGAHSARWASSRSLAGHS